MTNKDQPSQRLSMMSIIIPGMLVAATGVGSGDLLTASMVGSHLGLTALWAVTAGCVLKWVLNEGITRWQMATDTTLVEGFARHTPKWIGWMFLAYMVAWMFFTGGSLINACGIGGSGLLPLSDDPIVSRRVWGAIHAVAGCAVVLTSGFRGFGVLMSICVGIMFVATVWAAAVMTPDAAAVARHLVVPTMPADQGGWRDIVALLGGVGGTVTLLSYGYWIREQRRTGTYGLRISRIDLAVGYGMTGAFAVSMVIVGSQMPVIRGDTWSVQLADHLVEPMGKLGRPFGAEALFGQAGRFIFLLGFWGAVFSSLLGVWQSAPLLLADLVRELGLVKDKDDEAVEPAARGRSVVYYAGLIGITLLPLSLMWWKVKTAQYAYALLGASFMPLLAMALVVMTNQTRWMGETFRSRPLFNLAMVVTVVVFAYAGYGEAVEALRGFASALGITGS